MNNYERRQALMANMQPMPDMRLETQRVKDFDAQQRHARIEREWEEREYQAAIAAAKERKL